MGYITPEIAGKFPGYLSPSASENQGLNIRGVNNYQYYCGGGPSYNYGRIYPQNPVLIIKAPALGLEVVVLGILWFRFESLGFWAESVP